MLFKIKELTKKIFKNISSLIREGIKFMKLKLGHFRYDSGHYELRNVVDPIIQFGIFGVVPITIICIIIGAIYEISFLIWSGLSFFILLIGFFCYKYEFFSKKDPDRLQTEKFQREKTEMYLDALGKLAFPLPIESLSSIAPPDQPILIETEDKGDGDKE